jgi:hypothetical protein
MRSPSLALLALALCLTAAGTAAAGGIDAAPNDPDLKLGKTCGGHPSADALTERLPTYLKELVLLWPRAGKASTEHGCASVARLTVVNHQGLTVTMSFVLYGKGEVPPPRDYRRLDDHGTPRAVLEVAPSGEHPWILVEMAGGPATSREALEATLEFVPTHEIAARLAGD